MDQRQINLPIPAILFALSALFTLFPLSFGTFFPAIVFAFTSVILFLRRRDMFLVAAGIALCAADLFYFLRSVVFLFSYFLSGAYRFFIVFSELLMLAASVTLLTVILTSVFPNFADWRDPARRFWFVPGALCGAAGLFQMIGTWIVHSIPSASGTPIVIVLIRIILITASYLMLANWLTGLPDLEIPFRNPSGFTGAGADYGVSPSPSWQSCDNGWMEILTHVLLLVFTFGIWYYIWIYKTTKYLNRTPDEEQRNPVTKLLLCIFVPLYVIHWTYRSAQRIDKLAQSRGVPSDITLVSLILSIFVNILAPVIMQEKINDIAQAEQRYRCDGQNGYGDYNGPQGYRPDNRYNEPQVLGHNNDYREPQSYGQNISYNEPQDWQDCNGGSQDYGQNSGPDSRQDDRQGYPQNNAGCAETAPFSPENGSPASSCSAEPVHEPSDPAPAMPDTAEILHGYKTLLDNGDITQEYFDEKKKEILGL